MDMLNLFAFRYNGFFFGPQIQFFKKKISKPVYNLNFGYSTKELNVFSRLENVTSARRKFSYGLLRKGKYFDFGIRANNEQSVDGDFVVAVRYKPNPWSFLKFRVSNDFMCSIAYGFKLYGGISAFYNPNFLFFTSVTPLRFTIERAVLL